ncbi:hypothetical protein C8R46DRAFT_1224768 [Mycena filopes]|nr:hypothetical protein C8R46DRAFT_1224768 [Mycena filopes]
MLRCCWRPLVQLGRPFPSITRAAHTYPPPKNPLSTGPLAALHAFLAPANLTAKEPCTYSPKDLHKLYLAVKALPPRKKSYPLNVYELNELLVLFGSLSVRPPRPSSVHVHSFVSRLSPAPFRTYWALVLDLAEQIRMRPKRSRRTSAHHYWVMRAHLARMSASPSGSTNDPAEAATVHYRYICKTGDPAVHLPYLRTMLALRRPTHLFQITYSLCGAAVPTPVQARVLAMIATRLARHSYPSKLPRHAKLFRHAFDMLASHQYGPHRQLTIPQLCAALASALFPHFFDHRLPTHMLEWAAQEAKEVFGPQSPPAASWDSLMVLALCAAPKLLSSSGGAATRARPGVREKSGGKYDQHTTWRTVFALAMFERTVPQADMATAVRRLWRTWKDAEAGPPAFVRCIVVGAFFRLAARTADGPLKDGCARYCLKHQLWGGGSQLDVVQTLDLLVDYVFAAMHTQPWPPNGWFEIFKALPVDSDIPWRARVADGVLRELLPRDVRAAYGLYVFCEKSNLSIPTDLVHALAVALAPRYLTEALLFLNNGRFSPDQTEELLDCILRTLLRERHAFRDLRLADVILPALQRLYLGTGRTPAKLTKFPLRYALALLMDSEHPIAAVQLLRILDARQPSYFSEHFYLRIMRTLIQRHQGAAASLLPIVHRFPARARHNFRRKLALELARMRAHTLADKIYRFGGNVATTADDPRAARALGAVSRVPAARGPTAATAFVEDAGAHGSHTAGSIAVKLAVLSAYRRGMGETTITWLGNAVLNGALYSTKSRSARLNLKQLLNNRQQLEADVDFLQDRVTVNLLVKVLLGWRDVMDGAQIRRLFDHLVRGGYPVSARWRGVVPFGTAAVKRGMMVEIDLQRLSPFISFQRHVRPLYKMFIKAFHLQKDRQGARVVVGILHAIENEMMERRHTRERARATGIRQKKTKLANKIK